MRHLGALEPSVVAEVRMVVPTTVVGVAVVIALVIPGVVYGGVRTWLRGYKWSDQSTGARLLEAVLVSALLDTMYLCVLGSWLSPWIATPRAAFSERPATAGFAVLLTAVIVPAALALGFHADIRFTAPDRRWWPAWLGVPRRRTAYESTPTAWDKVAPTRDDIWVRVLLPNGRRVGGWMSGASYASTYPHARDIYIQEQFEMNADGSFGERVAGTAGVWLAITDDCIVEWLVATPEEGDNG